MFQFRIEKNLLRLIMILLWLIHQLNFMYLVMKWIILYCLSESQKLD